MIIFKPATADNRAMCKDKNSAVILLADKFKSAESLSKTHLSIPQEPMTVLEMRNCICNCLLLLVPEINFLLRFFYNRRAINNLLSILYSSNSFNCSFKVNFIPILWNCSTRKFKFLLFVTTMLKDVMYSIVIKPYTITFAIFKVCNFCIKKLIICGRCACLIVNSFSCSLIKSIAIRG